MKQSFLTSPLGVRFPRNHFLYKKYDEVMQRLLSAGIPRKLWNEFDHIKPVEKDKSEPKVLNVDDLSFGFIIWLFACGISSSIFISEIIFYVCKKLATRNLRKVVGLILFFKLLRWKIAKN
jgi:hypothetical protein